MNPFQQIPPHVRRWLYLAYGVVSLGCTALAAGFGAVGQAVPPAVIAVGAALVPIGAALGFTAASNTSEARTMSVTVPGTAPATLTADVQLPPSADQSERGAHAAERSLLVAAVLLFILALAAAVLRVSGALPQIGA